MSRNEHGASFCASDGAQTNPQDEQVLRNACGEQLSSDSRFRKPYLATQIRRKQACDRDQLEATSINHRTEDGGLNQDSSNKTSSRN